MLVSEPGLLFRDDVFAIAEMNYCFVNYSFKYLADVG